MTIKVMKYEIARPLNVDWPLFGRILSDLRHDSWVLMNRTVQMLWDFQMFSFAYKERFGEYPSVKDLTKRTIKTDIYNVLHGDFRRMNSKTFDSAIKEAEAKWKKHKTAILKGEESMISFKRDCPIILRSEQIKAHKRGSGYEVSLSLVSTDYRKELGLKTGIIDVAIVVGDKTQRTILDRIISGEYKAVQSTLNKRGKKWFLHLGYSFEAKTESLDPTNIMGVDMGIVNPLYVAFNHVLHRYAIGGDEIAEHRRRVERRRIAIQRQGKYCGDGRRGHGRKTRLKPIEAMSEKVANFRNTVNHKYSRYVVDLAVRHGCGTIQMEKLEGIAKDDVFLKNWTYYDLQSKITYKAQERGIAVILVEPKYTSQRCSSCGHIDRENRPNQSTFECVACGFTANADFNAARNIATKDIDKVIAEAVKQREKVEMFS